MAFDYSELVTLAQDLIAEYGRDVDLVKSSTTSQNPAQPWRQPADPAVNDPAAPRFTAKAVFAEQREEPGDGLLPRGFRGFLIAPPLVAPPFPPEEAELIKEVGAGSWGVRRVEVVKPGPTVVLYLVEIDQ